MLGVGKEKFIVAPPRRMAVKVETESVNLPCFTFLYASAPDCHKNFEVLCQAARLLEKEKEKAVLKWWSRCPEKKTVIPAGFIKTGTM